MGRECVFGDFAVNTPQPEAFQVPSSELFGHGQLIVEDNAGSLLIVLTACAEIQFVLSISGKPCAGS